MDDEPIDWKSMGMPLNLIGLAACAVALFSSGGLAFLGGAVAVACLAGGIAASLATSETPCERYWRECEEAPSPATASESAISQEPEASQSHHWRQSVKTSRCGSRRR